MLLLLQPKCITGMSEGSLGVQGSWLATVLSTWVLTSFSGCSLADRYRARKGVGNYNQVLGYRQRTGSGSPTSVHVLSLPGDWDGVQL